MGLIFDLDQTLIDTSISECFRKTRDWSKVYTLIHNFKLYPGIIEALHEFKNMGFEICVVTSSPRPYCLKVLNYWNIPFDFSVCYHDTTFKKPHPAPIQKALDFFSLKNKCVLSFGDKDIDIIASKKALVTSVACTWGSNDIKLLTSTNPDFTINNKDQLLSLVLNMRSIL